MRTAAIGTIVAASLLLAAAAAAQPGQWARFRGPDGGAVADDPRLPETWSETENVVWTADIPGLGWSSPVVWDDHVFLTTAVSAGTERAPVRGLYDPGSTSGATRSTAPHRWFVYDLDFDTGAVRWVRELQSAVPQIERHLKNLRRRRADCTKGSRRWREYNLDIRQASKHLTNLRQHQTVQMANAIVGENTIVGIEDFQADNARRSARGTHEAPGKNVQAKRGLSRALDYSRPGELKQAVKRTSERRGAVWNLVPPKNTSRRCAQCGSTAKEQRESQARFRCRGCADRSSGRSRP